MFSNFEAQDSFSHMNGGASVLNWPSVLLSVKKKTNKTLRIKRISKKGMIYKSMFKSIILCGVDVWGGEGGLLNLD